MFLLDDILFAPLKGAIWLGKRVQEMAQSEVDEGGLRARLLEAQESWMLGQLSDEDYQREEARLMDLLEQARQRQIEEGK